MNAQTLIDTTPSNNFEFSTFWKSNSSQVNNSNNDLKGDRFVEVTSKFPVESQPPQTDILSKVANKINNIKCKAVRQGDVFRELGVEVL